MGGGEGFEIPVRFLREFGVAWAIVCDGPAVGQSGRKNILHQLERAGTGNWTEWEDLSFADRKQRLAEKGVFTLANSQADEFEALAIIASNDAEAQQVGSSKVRKARFIAETYDCPPEVELLLRNVSAYLRIDS